MKVGETVLQFEGFSEQQSFFTLASAEALKRFIDRIVLWNQYEN